ncbi:hypothetical protein [Cupriavidus gilardii]|uniref:hypothetical protein n=1 Tax=Cupriavidus gilardii TaxID=82541 RepID=UPI0021BE5B52|nr:hypothetical protein [Cupriavidus gilardii]MCT9124102.1 hypothetical protein [Cupriavidus gilardii]
MAVAAAVSGDKREGNDPGRNTGSAIRNGETAGGETTGSYDAPPECAKTAANSGTNIAANSGTNIAANSGTDVAANIAATARAQQPPPKPSRREISAARFPLDTGPIYRRPCRPHSSSSRLEVGFPALPPVLLYWNS